MTTRIGANAMSREDRLLGQTLHLERAGDREPARGRLPPREARPGGWQPRRTVLFVDDDARIRDAVRAIVEHEGHGLMAVANGAEAVDYLRTGPTPDLIILDLQMPVMDGWAFLALRNRDPALRSIPVVVVSADDDAERRVAAANAAYFRKPIDPEKLIDTIERVGEPPARTGEYRPQRTVPR